MAKAKNPKRSTTPLGELSKRQTIVARIIPVTKIAPKQIPNNSGIHQELVRDRFVITANSIQFGLVKVGTGAGELLPLAPDTNFPLEMLVLVASFSDTFDPLRDFSVTGLFFNCHGLFNSTRHLVPPGVSSHSRIRSGANSLRFSFFGIGWPNSEKKLWRLVGEPL
ncbi:hypothetical protein SESBI_33997 [Sesbania bispinosa]|nr:hypothetical protein SESBI_33997 [Sesbania bispinosa]